MTAPAAPVNPFWLPGADVLRPAPPIKCVHPGLCACHVDVDHCRQQFETFQSVLADLGALQQTGLFVGVGGPTGCGKTSLINRGVTWARHALSGPDGRPLAVLDLTDVGRDPEVTIGQRVDKVGDRMVSRIRRQQQVFDPKRADPRLTDGEPLDLDDRVFMISEAMVENSVLIIVTPRAEQLTEAAKYWSATYKKVLIFTECPHPELPSKCAGDWQATEAARAICLETGWLRPDDGAAFSGARVNVPGRNESFPDLALDALSELMGEQRMSIGFAQTLLFRVFDYYLRNPWPPENIVRADDLRKFIMEHPEGQAG